jgi:hypothetical protein
MDIYCIKTPIRRIRLNYQKVYKHYITALLVLLMINSSFGQTEKITLHMNDVDLEKAFMEIRKQSEVSFLYNDEEVSNAPKVSISVDDITIEEALEQLLKGTGLAFEKVNNTIVIKPGKKNVGSSIVNPEILKQTIRGQVFDKDSKSTLPFATVQILNTSPAVGTTTDIDGNFIIDNVPVGRYTLKISFVGYADAFIPELLVGSAKEAIVTVELSEQVHALGEIVIRATNGEPVNEMAMVSAKPFNAEETKRYAATIGDPARMAHVFAGVSGTDDASNEIVIRGNSPNWLLWRLEGVEIPSPNHFAEEGYSSGAVSILSVNMLGNSDFYTGAFPAEYGNALSGVFDINLRNGNNKEHEFTIQAGVLGIDLSAEGPFKKGYNGSFLFNYRYSTLSLLNDMNIQVSENTISNYQDLSFKFHMPTKKAGTFALWGIGGNSDSDEKYLPDSTETENFDDGYSDFTSTGMYATGLNHTIFTGKKSYIHSVVSMSSSFSSENLEEVDSLGRLEETFFDDLKNTSYRFNTYYNRKISSRTSIRAGVNLSNLNYSYLTQELNDSTDNLNTYLDTEGSTNFHQAYAQAKYKFSDKVVFTAGLNYSHFALNNDNSLEPRLGMSIELPKQQKLSFGYGKHTMHENLPVYFVETHDEDGTSFMPNEGLKLTRSHHFVAAYEKMLHDNLVFKTEAYYQHIDNLPVANNPDKYWSPIFGGVNPNDTLANIGKGRNYGLEITLQKYFSNNYYFLVTSSLFESKYKPADGIWRDTRYNINYVNNFVGGKEIKWGDNKMLGLNGKIIWSGGKRLTPIDLEASKEAGETVYETDELFSVKGKDYFRLDLGVRLHFYRKKTEHVISLDIQNVTNRLNTWTHVYDAGNEEIIEYPMAGLIPVFNYRLEF